MVTLTPLQLSIFTWIILVLGILFGSAIKSTECKRRHKEELNAIKDALENEKIEKMKILMNRKHDIAHAITNEWNRGYNAAFDRLKYTYLYIHRWEEEHGISQGEMETLVQEFEKQERSKQEEQ